MLKSFLSQVESRLKTPVLEQLSSHGLEYCGAGGCGLTFQAGGGLTFQQLPFHTVYWMLCRFSQMFADFRQFSLIAMDVRQVSLMFMGFRRCSSIFTNFRRCSLISNDVCQCSPTLVDIRRIRGNHLNRINPNNIKRQLTARMSDTVSGQHVPPGEDTSSLLRRRS